VSNERDEIYDIARSVIDGELGILVNGSDIDNTADSLSYAVLAAGYSKPRTISTVKELDALPEHSVVRSGEGAVWESDSGVWYETASRLLHVAADIALPATVLYAPEESK